MARVSVVIPAHDEAENLPVLLERMIPALLRHEETRDFELILVDDNSKDDTPRLVDEYASDPRVVAVHRRGSPGFGNAVKAGLEKARGDIVVPVMADLSDDPEDIHRLVKKIGEGYDIAYGSRFCRGGYTDGYPWKKMAANRIYNNAVRLVFGIRHRDITNAFKAYRREVIEAIGVEHLRAEGFDLTVELPLVAHIMGFSSAEVPVSWHERKRGEAKLKLSQNGLKYGGRLVRLFIEGNLLSLRDIAHFLARGSWIHILAAVILGLLILIGVFSLAGLSEIARIMSNVNPGYIALACAAILITFVLRTWRWSVMLRTSGHRIHADTGFKCITFGWLANYILPLRIGDLMRGVALKTTENTPLSVGLSTVAVERAMDMLTLAVLLAGAIFVVSGSAVAYDLAFAALLIAVCLLAAMALVYRYDHVLFRVFGSRLDRYRGSLMAFKKGMEGLYGNPQAIALCVLLSFPIWGLELASIFLSARAIGVNLSPGLSTLAGISAFIMQSVPTTPAGIGVHEGTIAGILMLFGISADIGTSIALLDHLARGLVIFVFGTISGIHIGFESRKYFAQGKGVVRKGVANDEYSPELSAPALQIAEK